MRKHHSAASKSEPGFRNGPKEDDGGCNLCLCFSQSFSTFSSFAIGIEFIFSMPRTPVDVTDIQEKKLVI